MEENSSLQDEEKDSSNEKDSLNSSVNSNADTSSANAAISSDKVSDEANSEAPSNAIPNNAQEILDQQDAQQQETNQEPEKTPEQLQTEAEVNALKGVFADIRHQSRMSNLVTPDRWAERAMIPEHLSSQQFVDLVFDVIATGGVAEKSESEDSGADEDANAADGSAAEDTQAVQGKAPQTSEVSADDAASDQEGDSSGEDMTADADEADAENSEPVGALAAIKAGIVSIPCSDIVSMEGKDTMYLYSNKLMTDVYARWAFLANEDDRVATFVECVRQESKTYPRPMIYRALTHHPFDLTEDEVLDAWKATQETNLYPDIKSCTASNGDVYFYSDKYLDENYAKALAEYYSVERYMSP